MISLNRISEQQLQTAPYRWAVIDELFLPADAEALAATFPRDRFKLHAFYGGDKDSEYEARELIGMGERSVSGPEKLSSAWRALANDFLSAEYRAAMCALVGIDLSIVPNFPNPRAVSTSFTCTTKENRFNGNDILDASGL